MATIDEHVKVMMLKGEAGSSIKSIDKTATSGLTDTYTITLTNGDKQSFTVTNGKDGEKGEGVGTLKLGGRNLYTGTRDFSGNWKNLGSYERESEAYNGLAVIKKSDAGQGVWQPLDAKAGDTYTFSFWAKVEYGGQIITYVNILDSDSAYFSPSYMKTHIGPTDDGSSWKRYSHTFTVLHDVELAVRVENGVSGKALYVCGLKLERGNNATDWTPAPEDKADATIQQQIVPSASVESSVTASQAYQAGDYVVVNGLLRKATAAIAKGDAIGDSNSTSTTVTGELAKKVDSSELAGEWVTMLSTDGAWYCKRASMVIVQANNVTLSSNVKRKLGTLPSGYRPLMPSRRTSLIATTTYSQYTGILEVTSGGEVTMQAPISGDYTGQLVFPAAL